MFDISEYDVKKEGFSKSPLESVPVGDGDSGANVWVGEEGEINLLLSKSDSYTEAFRLAKLGLCRVRFAEPVFGKDNPPVLKLCLSDGGITVTDESGTVTLRIYAFRKTGCFYISASFSGENALTAECDIYRSVPKIIDGSDPSAYGLQKAPFEVKESADTGFHGADYIGAYHRNGWSYVDFTRKNQHLPSLPDIIKGRTFGYAVYGKNASADGNKLRTAMSESAELYISTGCVVSDDVSALLKLLTDRYSELSVKSPDYYINENRKYWTDYFSGYYISFSGTPEAVSVTRGCVYQKYMFGCANAGKMPIKFNGSIFTVHPSPSDPRDYDYRKWGAPFWIQNTRLIYWALLFGGDFEGMKPFFGFCHDVIQVCKERCRVMFGHGGLYLPETVSPDGAFTDTNIGYGNIDRAVPVCDNRYIGKHFNGALEISYMMFKYLEYTLDKTYFESVCLPFIDGVLEFFSEHFERRSGKLYLSGVSSLETWQDCENDTPDIAGLSAVVREMKKNGYKCPINEDEIPAIPTETRDGAEVIAPCGAYVETVPKNRENPELYPLFPYDIINFTSPEKDLKLAGDTFERVRFTHIHGWSQQLIFASLLGYRERLAEGLYSNFTRKAEGCFFDAYFGPNFDWTPDQNHGASNIIASIFSVLRCIGDKTKVCGSLPEGWHADARLPLPGGKTEYIS